MLLVGRLHILIVSAHTNDIILWIITLVGNKVLDACILCMFGAKE